MALRQQRVSRVTKKARSRKMPVVNMQMLKPLPAWLVLRGSTGTPPGKTATLRARFVAREA
jgi:hypothetical protein